MKKIILSAVFSFFCLISSGRDTKIDSLLYLLKKTSNDTDRVILFNELSNFTVLNDPKKSIQYGKEALELSINIRWKSGTARAYENLGNAFHAITDRVKALNYFFSAKKINEEMGDSGGVANNFRQIGYEYFIMNDIPTVLDYYLKSLNVFQELHDSINEARQFENIAYVYSNKGEIAKSRDYFYNALNIYQALNDKENIANTWRNIANSYSGQDSKRAMEFQNKAFKICEEINDTHGLAVGYGNIGKYICLPDSEYSDALKYFFKSLLFWEKTNNKREIGHTLQLIANTYYLITKENNEIRSSRINLKDRKKAADKSEEYYNKAILIQRELMDYGFLKDLYGALSEVQELTGKYKQALVNFKTRTSIRDSIYSFDILKKISNLETKNEIDLKDKEIQIQKLESIKAKNLRNAAIIGFSFLLIVGVVFVLLFNQKRKLKFEGKVSETEMKALRSQMNPHFIFNSLNSIKRYMANHDNKTAEDYLTKFASVMRMILENSEHKEVPLQEDLKALELYMQLESLRMKKKFNYEIKVDESIDKENTLIPPLILQPFVENSIWHGLAEKEGEGKILISINKVGEMIECTVEDNGVGRKKSEEIKGGYALVEKKSLGVKITNARIDILNKIKKSKAGVELVDLAEGMRVIVKLPLELSF